MYSRQTHTTTTTTTTTTIIIIITEIFLGRQVRDLSRLRKILIIVMHVYLCINKQFTRWNQHR